MRCFCKDLTLLLGDFERTLLLGETDSLREQLGRPGVESLRICDWEMLVYMGITVCTIEGHALLLRDCCAQIMVPIEGLAAPVVHVAPAG